MMTLTLALLAPACSLSDANGEDSGRSPSVDPMPRAPTGETGTTRPIDTGTVLQPGDGVDCEGGETYPAGAVEPMALGEVFSPYAWPTAVAHASDGARFALDLANVPCALDPDIDWSPFDVLLFVSIPAW